MSTMDQPVLQAQQVTLHAGARVLLEGLDWQVRAGQFWCVLGRNGIGKSSLLHAAAGLQQTTAGRWLLQGQAVQAIPPSLLARQRGLLLQQQYDAFSLPVTEAVMAGRFAQTSWRSSPEERRLAMAALEQVGLAQLADADLLQLSGGERQRIAMATLLVQDPALLLLDEPTSHQDIAAQLQIMTLLRALAAQGKALVASCHDINLASRFATHVLLLGERQRWAGAASEVLQAAALEEAFSCRFAEVEVQGVMQFMSLPTPFQS